MNESLFGRTGWNFADKQRVVMGRTSSAELDDKMATVVGVSVRDVSTIYIIQLDEPVSYSEFMVITMPEVCLAPVAALAEAA